MINGEKVSKSFDPTGSCLVHADFGQTLFGLSNDVFLARGQERVETTSDFGVDSEPVCRSCLDLAQPSLALLVRDGAVESANDVFALGEGDEPWPDVFGRIVALVFAEEASSEIYLWCAHGDRQQVRAKKDSFDALRKGFKMRESRYIGRFSGRVALIYFMLVVIATANTGDA